jgi:hypothetical protein
MRLGPFLGRALLWSAAGYAAWELLEPWSGKLLGVLTRVLLALSAQSFHIEDQQTHRGPVLFLALYLATRPPLRDVALYLPLGILLCLITQAMTIASFAIFPTDQTILERLMRSAAFALQNIAPILLWLIFCRRQVLEAVESRVGTRTAGLRDRD